MMYQSVQGMPALNCNYVKFSYKQFHTGVPKTHGYSTAQNIPNTQNTNECS